MPNDDKGNYEERIGRAMASTDVPKIYFNGFVSSIGTGDVVIIGERNGDPVVVLNMSYSVVKTLALSLGALVAQLEEKAGREILTTQDVERYLSEGEKKI